MKNILSARKILVGVTGSIAAYKSPLLIRELIRAGAIVRAIMTPAAREFVTPMLLANLTKNPVSVDMFDESVQRGGAWHIECAHWADLMIIAPCSAATMAKIASGMCDNALTTVAMALQPSSPLLIAPAMDTTMYLNPATQRNIKLLAHDGALIIPPEEGELSSGLVGPGRLPDVDVLIKSIENALSARQSQPVAVFRQPANVPPAGAARIASPAPIDDGDDLRLKADIELSIMERTLEQQELFDYYHGKRVLITAGPTFESIDDVRFIGNYSSGKMGFALARQARAFGAEVTLVSGPVSIETPDEVNRIDVQSARQMYNEVMLCFGDCDVAILAAAVADYTPVERRAGKIKKIETGDKLTLELISTDDILASLGKIKKPGQMLIGFALESANELQSGKRKMIEKNCDMIVINSVNKPHSGFGGDDNTITIMTRSGGETALEAMSKDSCAIEILRSACDCGKPAD